MIHLPFNIAVERGRSNILALGNVDNKEILIYSIKVDGADVTRVGWALSSDVGGGRDATNYAQSSYLGESIQPLFDVVTNPEIEKSTVVMISTDEDVACEKDGLTIPNGVYLILNVEAPAQGRVMGTITWDVRKANETF
jgi:hypothetical protein